VSVSSRRPVLLWGLAAALLGLLGLLATLQYRWLGEVSEAQRERLRANLERSARRFADDFDRELTRLFLIFQPVGGWRRRAEEPSPADALARWREEAPYPEMLAQVLHAEPTGAGLALECLDPATGEAAACAWPPEMDALRQRLEAPAFPRRPGETVDELLAAEVPAVVVPLVGFEPRFGRPEGRPRERTRISARGFLVLRLDREALRDGLLADLAARHFGDGEADVHLRIVDRGGAVVFEAGPAVTGASGGNGDAASELFGFAPFDDVRRPAGAGEPRRRGWALGALSHSAGRGWRLVVTHPSGSLEAAVAAVRRRNLAIGLGVLVLLGTTLVLLLAAARRAQVLARRQLEFVAGVTHELRTPLTAMRSAAQNLADGVVREPPQVARYGALIEHEGRRLSDMVEQALEYAGIQSGRGFARRPTAVAEVVEGALADLRPLLDEKGFTVETDLAPGLPDVLADAAALRRALGNLIGNAVKYAAAGAWLRVSARAEARGEVRLAVADRGPGIAPEDLPHVFEPFYRGRDLAAGRVPGSGLGLALVRHVAEGHGGRVTVASRPGKGATFTLCLPAAPASRAVADAEARAVAS
jgi:signal transduction histidine kinase